MMNLKNLFQEVEECGTTFIGTTPLGKEGLPDLIDRLKKDTTYLVFCDVRSAFKLKMSLSQRFSEPHGLCDFTMSPMSFLTDFSFTHNYRTFNVCIKPELTHGILFVPRYSKIVDSAECAIYKEEPMRSGQD